MEDYKIYDGSNEPTTEEASSVVASQ